MSARPGPRLGFGSIAWNFGTGFSWRCSDPRAALWVDLAHRRQWIGEVDGDRRASDAAVPPRILNYNDAAADARRGAARDRTRRSYIRGAWSSSSTVDSTAATTQYLRSPGTLSAIAAVFAHPSRLTAVTVAQVLWEQDDQVREFFGILSGTKSLADLIAGRSTSTEIRRAARTAGWEVHDTFAAYGERLRALLHIPGDKALEVFNRAIGMKEVGDVDAFVRQFMMPSAETFAFIRDRFSRTTARFSIAGWQLSVPSVKLLFFVRLRNTRRPSREARRGRRMDPS